MFSKKNSSFHEAFLLLLQTLLRSHIIKGRIIIAFFAVFFNPISVMRPCVRCICHFHEYFGGMLFVHFFHTKSRKLSPPAVCAGKLRTDLFLFCFCYNIFAEVHQHSCYLCSGCSALRCQSGCCHTIYNTVGICPLHCFYSIAADGSAVCIVDLY